MDMFIAAMITEFVACTLKSHHSGNDGNDHIFNRPIYKSEIQMLHMFRICSCQELKFLIHTYKKIQEYRICTCHKLNLYYKFPVSDTINQLIEFSYVQVKNSNNSYQKLNL